MWLKMYLGDLYVDKERVEFNDMDTAKEKQRHLEQLANGIALENNHEIISSGIQPKFYIQHDSYMNMPGFNPGSWKKIIQEVGGKTANQNIEELSNRLTYEKVVDIL